MKEFIQRYEDRIHGVLSCFDRMLFRGYLPIMSGWQMAQFFNSRNIRFRMLKTFLLEQAQRVKQPGIDLAKQEGRPFQYVQEKTRKDDVAKEIAVRDKIDEGLIVVFSVLELSAAFPIPISAASFTILHSFKPSPSQNVKARRSLVFSIAVMLTA